jgi:hypothetical protein
VWPETDMCWWFMVEKEEVKERREMKCVFGERQREREKA